ncbi:hypothetical protein K2173_009163 [Erythroxylum novogranatense]|uniref:Rrn7/TAF1B N-terminal cyclin domain-containing protein n=1 Tax=Erythroxylum novogranatense TaxID=1862640 RepID=A0AAV8TFD1_9ROSI|nr:hypothetical protein K2173_009163 [Erythroxylum novogranatense]
MERDYDDEETKRWACRRCGHIGLDESDGFYYCQECGTQADDIILTGVADEDFVDKDGDGGAMYSARFTRRSQVAARSSQSNLASQSLFHRTQEGEDEKDIKIKKEEIDYTGYYYMDGIGPTEPEDFGANAVVKLSYEDYYNEVRLRYVMGVQWMIQMQCDALVEKFKVHPLVRGVASSVWLRFVVGTGVFKDGWADDVLLESEAQKQGELEEHVVGTRYSDEPHNAHGQRAVMVWFRELRKTIPLSCSLAISFLACHVVREAVLPTDLMRWSVEGKLPYFAAHVEIEKRFGQSSPACPISSSVMFRPSQAVLMQKLESMAASIAESIGLHLPPVNFYQIACRYLKKLSLPVEEILQQACRINDWLPTRVGVMSILIVAIRILYNINGFGVWERSLFGKSGFSSKNTGRFDPIFNSELSADAERGPGSALHEVDDVGKGSSNNSLSFQMSELDTADLLQKLEARYYELVDTYEFASDLPSYLQYCKDVVFAGLAPSYIDHREEEEMIEKLWDFYQNAKDPETEELGMQNSTFNQKRSRNDEESAKDLLEKRKAREWSHDSASAKISCRSADYCPQQSLHDNPLPREKLGGQTSVPDCKVSTESLKDKAIRRLKVDMEENRFCYIPPRVKVKRFDYLHYVRKNDDGALTYVAHADYYILLRACARVAVVDIRIMHIGVLSFEKRLAWLEKRIDYCLNLTLP